MSFQEYFLVGCLSVLTIICAVVTGWMMFSGTAKKNGVATAVVLTCLMFVSLVVGGAKSMKSATSTDEDIDLLDIVLNPIEEVTGNVTNVLGSTFVISVAPGSSAPQPIWFRDSVHNTWTNVTTIAQFDTPAPILDPTLSSSATNVYTWTTMGSYSNLLNHAQWYIGTELPAVEIDVTDSDVITITEFNMTSKRVHIAFALSGEVEFPEGTLINVERKLERGLWQTIDTFPAVPEGFYTWNGFEVGRRTSWRLSISKTEEVALQGVAPANE